MDVIRAADYTAAAAELARRGADARIVGGGQSLAILVRLGFLAPEVLISLAACEAAHRLELRSDCVLIGARWTVAQAAADAVMRTHAPGVAQAAATVASPHVRNFATVAGNICHGDPANDLAAPLLCYDARVVARSASGVRLIDLDEFFLGPYETALGDEEFVSGIEVDRLTKHRSVYRKVFWRGADHPVASAAVVLRLQGDTIVDARVALGACVAVPRRLSGVERALVGLGVGSVTADVVSSLVGEVGDGLEFLDDSDIPARYRRKVSTCVVTDAVLAALTGDDSPQLGADRD